MVGRDSRSQSRGRSLFQEVAAMATTFDAVSIVGVSGSPAASSRSRTLLESALGALERYGTRVRQVDLAGLPADALLARRQDPEVADAVAAVLGARIIVVSTPIYRATYS